MRIPARWHVLEAVALAVAAYVAGTGSSGMRRDELLCEEALARLDECCPAADLENVHCAYMAGCMGHEDAYPDIGPSDSTCIREATCGELVSLGLCDLLRDGPLNGERYLDLQVCP